MKNTWILLTIILLCTSTLKAQLNVGSITITSDVRLNKDIAPLENALGGLMQLKAVRYDKKETIASANYSLKEIGLIAQDVRKVFPSFVFEGKDAEKILSVNYNALIPVLIKAMQEQQAQYITQVTALQQVLNVQGDIKLAMSKANLSEIERLKKENISMATQLADMKDLKLVMAELIDQLKEMGVQSKLSKILNKE